VTLKERLGLHQRSLSHVEWSSGRALKVRYRVHCLTLHCMALARMRRIELPPFAESERSRM